MKLPIYREFVGQRSVLHSTSSHNQPKPDGGKLYRKPPPDFPHPTHSSLNKYLSREEKKKNERKILHIKRNIRKK